MSNYTERDMKAGCTVASLRRDSFARASLQRIRLSVIEAKCQWCGNPAKYAFGWVDDTHEGNYVGPFDSVACFEAYTT